MAVFGTKTFGLLDSRTPPPLRKMILQMHTAARSSQCWSRQTPAWTSVHLDAPGQRHGQQPVSGTADPRSSQTGQVIRGLRRHNQNTFGPTEGQNEQWREANRRRQRQTIRYRGFVPNAPGLRRNVSYPCIQRPSDCRSPVPPLVIMRNALGTRVSSVIPPDGRGA